jgi:hypothetical protein
MYEEGLGICRWSLLAESPAPRARLSLAQHGAAGGVLGNGGNRSKSRRDARCSHLPAGSQIGTTGSSVPATP